MTEHEKHTTDVSAPDRPQSAESKDAKTKKPADAEAKLSDLEDKFLRALADAENARKRAARARTEGHVAGIAEAVNALLPTLDNIELALKNRPNTDAVSVASLFDGVEATRRVFIEGLKSLGVERLDPTGEAFDPNTCEAMSVQEVDTAPTNTVLETVQPGYRRGDYLIRPAFVVVSKVKNSGPGESEDQHTKV